MMEVDLSNVDRRTLKELAFLYHYGSFVSVEAAKATLAYEAAAEMARRGEYKVPEPHIIGDLFA